MRLVYLNIIIIILIVRLLIFFVDIASRKRSWCNRQWAFSRIINVCKKIKLFFLDWEKSDQPLIFDLELDDNEGVEFLRRKKL
jgi:hypothetical protein